MKKAHKQILILLIISCSTLQCSTDFEVVIIEGTIYDGSGDAPIVADIGISDGIIRKIGKINPVISLISFTRPVAFFFL